MRLPEPNPEHQRWDDYKAFHWSVSKVGTFVKGHYNLAPFVVFDTGEVICNLKSPEPDKRGEYRSLDVSVTTSKECPPLMTPDGKPVAKAWLDDNGMQYLLVDHHTERVVRLDRPIELDRDTRPKRFQPPKPEGRSYSYGAYFAGEGLPPLGARPVVYTNKWLTPEDNEAIDTLLCQARAVLALEGFKPSKNTPVFLNQLLGKTVDTLNEAEKTAVVRNSIRPAKYMFDYLLLRS